MWIPDLSIWRGPRYQGIVAALADAVERGELRPGDRLPPQRELAERLGVSLGTVTRAYAEAAQRGLSVGEVGRGTFVRDPSALLTSNLVPALPDPDMVDLSLLVPPTGPWDPAPEILRHVLDQVRGRSRLGSLLAYQPHAGSDTHRSACADWLAEAGIEADPASILLTGSAQHAVTLAHTTLSRPGDVILTEGLTSPGMRDLAGWQRFVLAGVAMDGEGVLPDALDVACRQTGARVLHIMPTEQLPTSATASLDRRMALLEVARRHDLTIVEDGTLGLLRPEAPPPLSALDADRVCYVTSLSKIVAPGLRLGAIRAPARLLAPLTAAMRATLWMVSPLLAEMAALMITSGEARRIAEAKREESRRRLEVAAGILGRGAFRAGPNSYHIWVPADGPDEERRQFERLRRSGILVTSSDAFSVSGGRHSPGLRLCLSAARDRVALREALQTYRVIRSTPEDTPPAAAGLL